MAKLKIKKGDKVVVLSGSNKGQTGTVLRVFPDKAKAIVEGVNIAKKRVKPSAQNPQGGVVEKEAQIYFSRSRNWESNESSDQRRRREKSKNC